MILLVWSIWLDFSLTLLAKNLAVNVLLLQTWNKAYAEILERITAGEGREGDIELLEELSESKGRFFMRTWTNSSKPSSYNYKILEMNMKTI